MKRSKRSQIKDGRVVKEKKRKLRGTCSTTSCNNLSWKRLMLCRRCYTNMKSMEEPDTSELVMANMMCNGGVKEKPGVVSGYYGPCSRLGCKTKPDRLYGDGKLVCKNHVECVLPSCTNFLRPDAKNKYLCTKCRGGKVNGGCAYPTCKQPVYRNGLCEFHDKGGSVSQCSYSQCYCKALKEGGNCVLHSSDYFEKCDGEGIYTGTNKGVIEFIDKMVQGKRCVHILDIYGLKNICRKPTFGGRFCSLHQIDPPLTAEDARKAYEKYITEPFGICKCCYDMLPEFQDECEGYCNTYNPSPMLQEWRSKYNLHSLLYDIDYHHPNKPQINE